MSSGFVVADLRKEKDGSSSRHLAYTKRSFSGFLAPSRRSHPHVEPLLAPLWNFWQANRGLKCFWAFKECISTKDTSSLKPPLVFCPLMKSPLLISVIKPLCLWRNAQRPPFPLISPLVSLFFIPPCLPFYFPFYPLNPPKIPLKFYPYLLFSHFPPINLQCYP